MLQVTEIVIISYLLCSFQEHAVWDHQMQGILSLNLKPAEKVAIEQKEFNNESIYQYLWSFYSTSQFCVKFKELLMF